MFAWMAHTHYERLQAWIKQFEDELGAEEELVVSATLPGGGTMLVDDIGYQNPSLLVLYGRDSESRERIQLLVHVFTAQLEVRTRHRADPTEPKRKIGFKQAVEDAGEDPGPTADERHDK